MVAKDEFLEYAQVFGKYSYGTPKKWLEESRRRGLDLVLEIDVQGAQQVKQKLPESVAIFILPPSREEVGTAAAQPGPGRERRDGAASGEGSRRDRGEREILRFLCSER